MKNCIDACAEFSYQGKNYSPSATIELDHLLERDGALPSIHALLAEANGIDTYSYLYEVMEQADIGFSNAQGLAADFVKEGCFDQEGFVSQWHADKVLCLLQPIAARELGIDDLERHPELKNALIQAFNLGKRSGVR
jgi:hypothetical protein